MTGKIDQQIKNCRFRPMNLFIGGALACGVFFLMGLSQLDLKYVEEEPPQPLMDIHLPPPPPPKEVQVVNRTAQSALSINFSLPMSSEPSSIPIGFLDVDFGLNPKILMQIDVSVEDSLDDFRTEEIKGLEIYDAEEVDTKPVRRYTDRLSIPNRYTKENNGVITFTYIARIDKHGVPVDIHFSQCSCPEAIPLLRKWVSLTRFWPARKDGHSVDCIIKQDVTYNPANQNPFSI